ncbi:MAG: FAD-dependent oxidoreductase [Ligilactobacillus sp.]|nr:FAD-dependent oxidoreductase [Ligilactobacillus sp.]
MGQLKNGTYQVSTKGFKGNIDLAITIKNEQIAKIDILKEEETPNIGGKALTALVQTAQGRNNFSVDGISGASYTSKAFNQALTLAKIAAQDEKQEATLTLNDGQYTTTVNSFQEHEGLPGIGKMTMLATFKNNKITDIEVPEYTDTHIMGGMAFDILAKKAIAKQSTDLDVVTGASVSSNAFRQALDNCILQAGGQPEIFAARKIKQRTPIVENLNTDIVVIGAGMAGLCAAIEATDQGAKVLICEAQEINGSSSTRSEGFVMGAGTKEQAKHGIEDTTDAFFEDIYSLYKDEPTIDTKLMRKLTHDSTDLNNFLMENGVTWSGVTHVSEKGVRNLKRAHTTAGLGAELIENLVQSAQEKGVDLRYGLAVDRLITLNGQVQGVVARNKLGDTLIIHASSVIVAAGSYTENPEMVKELNPRMNNIEVITGRGNGSAMRFFKQAGAQIIDVPYIQMMYYFYGASWGDRFPEAIPGSPTLPNYDVLEVDGGGRRVASEDDFCFEYTKRVWDGGYNEGYAIFGQVTADKYPEMTDLGLTTKTAQGKPFGYCEDSIKALATDVGIDPQTLEATVARYNELCEKGVDEDFHKNSANMIKITAPYYLVRLPQICTDGYTGAKINENAQVLDEDNQVIKGLYACGSCADSQMTGINYFGCGTSLLTCGVYGRAAAKDAVSRL